jgi:hypothetical protein
MHRFAYWVSAVSPLFIGTLVMIALGIAETSFRRKAPPRTNRLSLKILDV